jgi:hypothetical protein
MNTKNQFRISYFTDMQLQKLKMKIDYKLLNIALRINSKIGHRKT